MKKLIYSQEDVDLILSLKEQDYEEEIYDLKQEIEYLRSVGSLVILDKKCKKLQDRIDKAVEYNKEIIKALLSCCSYEKDKVEDMLYEQQNILESKGE